ncbi:MAG: hypothetical protein PHS37_03955 [Candidatus Omnitrophica bacterium]|nr:hypothetical protein [Candidatus Omnitrophota bacterium]
MKYKTVIEIISDADNPAEAADLAGDYLQGHLETGITMRCYTKPVRKIAPVAALFIGFIVIGILGLGICFSGKKEVRVASTVPSNTVNAIQPPLKTSATDSHFRGDWKTKKNSAEIDFIKK